MTLISTIGANTGQTKNRRRKPLSKQLSSKGMLDQYPEMETIQNNIFTKSYLNRNRSRL